MEVRSLIHKLPGDLAYVLSAFVVGVAAFVIEVTLLSLSFGLLITLVGIPVFVLTVLVTRGLAEVERARARLIGLELRRPYRPQPQESLWRRFIWLMGDPATWLELVYFLVLFPLAVFSFTVLVTLWSFAVAAVTYPLWFWVDGAATHVGDRVLDSPLEVALMFAAGLVALPLALLTTRGLALVHGALARALVGRETASSLRERVDDVTRSRSDAVNAAAAERRRIERDLHDGAQQQMTAVAMALGRARERFDDDPEGAQALVAEAHEQAKTAIAELRNLARGIHPAVLTDRGLDAALSGLAARAPIPVEVEVELDERPPASIESIAYFVVAEGLANAAKHAEAERAWVRVRREGETVRVVVGDDGRGGAAVAPGGGLEGIAARVAAVDGALTVSSPPSGGTVLAAELPCA